MLSSRVMIHIDRAARRAICSRDRSAVRAVGRKDPLASRQRGSRRTARRSSRSRGATRRAAGRSGRRDFSSGRRCCSSTRPATRVPRLGATRTSSAWRRTSPTSASTTTASTTSAPTATCGGWRARDASTPSEWELRFYELALKVSGAVQARRWTRLPDGGFIHSFNGAHSLFVDTIRSLRALALGALLGHRADRGAGRQVNLLDALVQHARATAQYNVYSAAAATATTSAGASAHESLFNVANGTYRGPSTQQGYSPFTHLDARAGLGDARLRRAARVPRAAAGRGARGVGGRAAIDAWMLDAARATCDYYIDDAARRRRAVLGRRRARPRRARRLGRAGRRSVQRSRAGRQLRRGDRRAGSAAARPLLDDAGDRRRRATCRPGLRVLDTLFDDRPVSEPRSRAPGPAAAFGLSLAERMGPRAARRAHAARRIEPVGRLPRARGRALREAARRGRTVSDVLRPDRRRRSRSNDAAPDHGADRRSSPAARAASAWASRARWRATAGTSLLCGVRPDAEVEQRRRRAARSWAAASTTSPPTSRASRPIARGSSTTCAARFGAVNALVNNAGRAPRVRADLLDATEDSFEELMRTNLQGPYFLTQAIARDMVERRASRRRVPRPRSSSSRPCRPRWRRSTAASTASARRASRWRRGCSRCGCRRTASRSTKCGPGSSRPT